jgi:AraC-like DNA-binding protein
MQVYCQYLVLLLAGFSIISAAILALSHLNYKQYQNKLFPQIAGLLLLLGLSYLQISHFVFLMGDSSLVLSRIYIIALFLVSPAFYFFSRDVLKVDNRFHPLQLLHLLPLIVSFFLSRNHAQLLAFFIGTGYVLWLAFRVYSLRAQRARFKLELFALAAMLVVAMSVLVLGVVLPLISDMVFYTSYAALLGLGFVVVVFTLLRFPDITNEVTEAAQAAYASSTLNNHDSEALVLRLCQLLEVEKLYAQETLSLSSLARQMEISSHQLSELINTRFNKSFSQLIREYRVTEAKRMLIDEPKASVLSIGLSTGFTSQSNFYTAFREITGTAPGNYRRKTRLDQ